MSAAYIPAMPDPPTGTPFVYNTPFVLIRRGGRQPGKRPNTVLAYVCAVKGRDGGKVLDFKVRIYRERDRKWTLPRAVDERDIVASWRYPPSVHAVRQAKQRLAPDAS